MFKVKYDIRVKDDIENIPKKAQKRIKAAIENKLETQPDIFGKPLRRSLKGFRSLRVGVYRVVFLIEKKTVLVLAIAHRKDIYEMALKRK